MGLERVQYPGRHSRQTGILLPVSGEEKAEAALSDIIGLETA
jgi:hypothetical protein